MLEKKVNYTSSCAIATNLSTVMTCGKDFTPYIFNEDSKIRFKILAGVLAIIFSLATFQNSAVLLVMLKERSIRKIRLYKFLMVLTSVDLMVATITTPLYIAYNMRLSEGRFCCQLGRLLLTTAFSFLPMSITTIVFITFQLYLAILHPFVYTGNWNNRMTLPLLISLNVMWVIFTSLMIVVFDEWWSIYRMVVSSFILVVYLVMCCLHFCIYREAKRVRDGSLSNTSLECSRVTYKTLKLATSVLISFGICYIPYVSLTVYTMVEELTPYMNTYFDPWGEILGMTTCVWDPLLYCLRFDSIRKRVVGLFGRKKIRDINETTKRVETTF